jgi:phosphoglycerol transferase MdoB-like AlkP superfamily enzyme
MAMTTSNHPPYDIPDSYKGQSLEFSDEMKSRLVKSEEYSLKRFRAFQYSNNMLARFIDKIKNSKLAENTFIIFTGDHNFWDIYRFKENEKYSSKKVPLYMYIPPKYKKSDYSDFLNKFSTTVDIMPTIIPLTLSEARFISFGKNLFSTKESYSMNSSSLIANKSGAVIHGVPLEWEGEPGSLVRRASAQNSKEIMKLDIVYRSMISIHELFLKSLK